MKNLLLIDFSNTVMRSMAVHSQLSWEGTPTGGLYGFVSQLAGQINKASITHIMVCKDHPPYLRKTDYPEYKEDRKTTEKPEWYEHRKTTFSQVEIFLRLAGIQAYDQEGLEADDLIATIVDQQASQFDQVFILSNDDDLYQLLAHDNVTLLKVSGNMDVAKFADKYPGISPEDWNYVTALMGSHNNVAGIPGVGIKTALKLVAQFRESGKYPAKMEQHKELIERNLKLVTLPYPSAAKIRYDVMDIPQLNQRALMRYLSQYGINYSGAMQNAFSHFDGSQFSI